MEHQRETWMMIYSWGRDMKISHPMRLLPGNNPESSSSSFVCLSNQNFIPLNLTYGNQEVFECGYKTWGVFHTLNSHEKTIYWSTQSSSDSIVYEICIVMKVLPDQKFRRMCWFLWHLADAKQLFKCKSQWQMDRGYLALIWIIDDFFINDISFIDPKQHVTDKPFSFILHLIHFILDLGGISWAEVRSGSCYWSWAIIDHLLWLRFISQF